MGCPVSCGKPDNPSFEQATSGPNLLRYDVNNPFMSLNPAQIDAAGSTHVFPLLYSYLFVPDEKGKLEPDLAEKWLFNPNSMQWTFKLRDDARFHDNRKVTSTDVKYSLEQMKHQEPELYSSIRQISLESDTSLTIHLKKADPHFPRKIWDCEILPHPGNGDLNYFDHPVGSGPFIFKSRLHNREIQLVANADYYNGRPSLDGVIFRYQPDREKAWVRLLGGKTDIAQEISPKNFEIIKQYEDRFFFDHYLLYYYTILLFNTHDPLFSDPTVRRALTLAIDRRYIVKSFLRGFGKVASGPMGINSPFHNPSVKALPYNPARASALLKAVGWRFNGTGNSLEKNGEPFCFTVLVSRESQVEKKVARFIQLCLNELGIKVRLRAVGFDDLKYRYIRNTQFQAVLTELHGIYRNPEYLRTLWSGNSEGESDAGCFTNPAVTQLIHKAMNEKNPEVQKQLFYEIDSLIAELQPGVFLYQKTAIDAMSKRFALPSPFNLEHHGIHRLKDASLR